MQHITSLCLIDIGDRIGGAGYIVLSSKRLDKMAREIGLARRQAALQQHHIARAEQLRQGYRDFSGHRLSFGGKAPRHWHSAFKVTNRGHGVYSPLRGRSRPFYGVSKAMKSRYMTGAAQNPAGGQIACATFAAALICALWRPPPAFTSEPSGSDPSFGAPAW